jgi:hypothetical protein
MFGRRSSRQDRPAPQWPRQKMLALLIAAGTGCVVLVLGLVLAVVYAIGPGHGSGGSSSAQGGSGHSAGHVASGSGGSRAVTDPRDVLADKAMPEVGEDASHPSAVSPANPGELVIPAPSATGPAQVPTGFPHTPAGALAQLAAIDQIAMQSGSLAGARDVIASWAVHGGPDGATWSVVTGLGDLFNELGLSGGGSGQLALVLTPLMGQIKGRVGPDFVIPCVDFELDVTLQQTARGATADCQRMIWQPAPGGPAGGALGKAGGRWVIGSGPEPATPPSVWPDTATAIVVGYQDLRTEPHR